MGWTQIVEGPMDSYKSPGKAAHLDTPSLPPPTKEFSDTPRDLQGVGFRLKYEFQVLQMVAADKIVAITLSQYFI